MKPILNTVACLIVLTILGACDHRIEVDSTYADGGTVSVENGQGKAKAWGIAFEVDDISGGTASARTESSSQIDQELNLETRTFSIGDVKIRLERVAEGPISVWIDDKPYGTQKSGTKIAIDASRQVTIDGVSK